MDTLLLNNGAREEKVLVACLMLSLNKLFTDSPLAFYDLVSLCRDATYDTSYTFADLRKLNLVQPAGTVHESIKNVVLSAAKGDGLGMTLGSPVAEAANA